jgi:CPA2 family monovalent cation:H+ antiporter-2
MVGAFGAGLMLNGNRLTLQIDAVILPFRETFAAVFFVSLGTLIRLDSLMATPLASIAALAGILVLKACAGGIALRLSGLPWLTALGMGMGLAQVGEFAFVLLTEGFSAGVIGSQGYDLMMFVAVASLILTPQILKIGLRIAERGFVSTPEVAAPRAHDTEGIPRAVVIGIGPIGSQTASQLELKGYDVCLIDLSAVNLHRFAQQGFRTVVGDASVRSVLEGADVPHSSLVVVTVPEDHAAMRIVSAARRLNKQAIILVRCRFQASLTKLRTLGATDAFSEETELASKVFTWLDTLE